MSQSLIDIKNVTKIYRDKKALVKALDGVDLMINKGEILSLLGINGAGKTTLSSILATLHPPTSGDVLFKGNSIYKNLIAYRKALGFCPQLPNLDKELTVQENLLFDGRYFLMDRISTEKRAVELMKRFGLSKYASFPVHALSGGYKQRLSIARALMHSPEFVILDEPTVGLDPDIRRQLWDVILELKAQGITVLLTTHYLEEAELLSDRVCILSNGKIMLTETVQDLKSAHKQETLEKIFLQLTKEDNDTQS